VLNQKVEQMSRMEINDFDVDKRFSLNQSTVNYIANRAMEEKATGSESFGLNMKSCTEEQILI
jgi:hypothetical protein